MFQRVASLGLKCRGQIFGNDLDGLGHAHDEPSIAIVGLTRIEPVRPPIRRRVRRSGSGHRGLLPRRQRSHTACRRDAASIGQHGRTGAGGHVPLPL